MRLVIALVLIAACNREEPACPAEDEYYGTSCESPNSCPESSTCIDVGDGMMGCFKPCTDPGPAAPECNIETEEGIARAECFLTLSGNAVCVDYVCP